MEIKEYIGEVWKDIYYYDRRKNEWVDYRGLYQVSNFGRVRGMDRQVRNKHGVWVMKGHINANRLNKKTGYLQVSLYKNNKHKNHTVHRLVAYMFIPNPNNLPEVNHKDEDKTNNMVSNLEWCDHIYNNTYNGKGLKIGVKLGKKVNQYSLTDCYIDTYASSKEAERVLKSMDIKVSSRTILKCCKGKAKTSGGFKWSYAE